ncbi:MAG: 3-phosphoshikimate 1-carboxyvinyltransferase [Ruminococcaceae bacterium]|nr:3-phosphoshikimate 1-carboxyvinyltransferase [Oscillospiraceae bacterium]
MNVKLPPCPLGGVISAIPSKSDVHRTLICAALSDKVSTFSLPARSADVEATVRCLRALGASITIAADTCRVEPITTPNKAPVLDCGESGSTLRFLLPVAAALGVDATFTGHGRLPERPIGELLDALTAHGVTASAPHLPLTLHGNLSGGDFPLAGDISSQYISGLLLALPLTKQGGDILLTTPLQSGGYVDMTRRTMARFGVDVCVKGNRFSVESGSHYRTPDTVTVEGDWSNAAFWLAAGAVSREVTVNGLDLDSAQGDRTILSLLQAFGADATQHNDAVTVSPAPLVAQNIDMGEIPDLLPPLAVVAAVANGTTRLYNAARCRLKECDRIHGMATLLTALGIGVEEEADALIIHGGTLRGGTVDSQNDHRLVMAAAIAATRSTAAVTIRQSEAVTKSYPAFFAHYEQLGGHVI